MMGGNAEKRKIRILKVRKYTKISFNVVVVMGMLFKRKGDMMFKG
jgi:hypothetical protein